MEKSKTFYFTSEQISYGHPDKICDQLSDTILDFCLKHDNNSRVACEVMGKNKKIFVAGEVRTDAPIKNNVETIIKDKLKRMGFNDWAEYEVINALYSQSNDIALGVDVGGAGDQGIMFGYATNETEHYMPLAWVLSNEVLKELKKLNHSDLGADAKSQVTLYYDEGVAKKIKTFLVSVQHKNNLNQKDVIKIVKPLMIKIAKKYKMNTDFEVLINPTGRFVIGGFEGDAGLTGRKIIADTYGGYARHGGGAFSGKDATKVDRSGAYVARWIAKNLVHLGYMHKCEVQLSYAIGVKQPVSIFIEDFGTIRKNIDTDEILIMINNRYDLSPNGIIKLFSLDTFKYSDTSAYGHFGNNEFPWEQLNLILN